MTRFRLFIWYKNCSVIPTQVVEADSYEEAEKMAIIDPFLELEFIEVSSLMDDLNKEYEEGKKQWEKRLDDEDFEKEWERIEEEEWNNPLSPL